MARHPSNRKPGVNPSSLNAKGDCCVLANDATDPARLDNSFQES
jgi:hypothetical protein